MTYIRDRAQKETMATVEDRTRVFPNTAGRMGDQPGEAAPAEFGLHVEELTPARGQRVGMEGQKGAIVTEIDPATFADDLGFTRSFPVFTGCPFTLVMTSPPFKPAFSAGLPGSTPSITKP